jgi:hypothetical protein
MLISGFCTQLFNQVVTVLSALSIGLSGGGGVPVPADAATGAAGEATQVAAAPALRQPHYLQRVLQTQFDAFVEIGGAVAAAADAPMYAVLAIPADVTRGVNRAGVLGLPAGVANSGVRFVRAISRSSTGLIDAVSDALISELGLLGGGDVREKLRAELAQSAGVALDPALAARRVGAVEFVVRVPLAFGVAASDLIVSGLQATTMLTGGVADATATVIRAVTDPKSELTLKEAIQKVPETLATGGQNAVQQLKTGVSRAANDFRATLNPRVVETKAAGANAAVSADVVATTDRNRAVASTDLNAAAAKKAEAAKKAAAAANGGNRAGRLKDALGAKSTRADAA